MFSQSFMEYKISQLRVPVSEKCPLLSWLESVFPLRPPSVLRVSEHSNAPLTRDRRFARREVTAGKAGVCVCLLLQDLLQSCSRGGEEESGRHVL